VCLLVRLVKTATLRNPRASGRWCGSAPL